MKGFTLIELIVSITIIIFIASTTFIAYNEITVNSRDARRKADLELIRAALEQYKAKFNTYPVGETSTNKNSCKNNRSSTNPNDYLLTTTIDPSGNTVYTQQANGCILGALVIEGFIDKLPIDPGVNALVDSSQTVSTCNNNQFYEYSDLGSNGANYALGSVEEALKNTGCPASPSSLYCRYTNNIIFSYCVGPLGERDS